MAIYSCNISNVRRAKGSNACATLSYISGERVTCTRTGESFSYGKAERVANVSMHLPANCPAEWNEPATFFNAIENYEKAENARPAKKVIVALPKDFDLDLQKQVLANYCQKLTSLGYGCCAAIHHDTDNKNPHAHILIANRPIANGKFVKCKKKSEYVRDENGDKVPLIDKKTGEQKLGKRNEKLWKRRTVKKESNPLDEKTTLILMRSNWETVCNQYLAENEKISCKSHKSRGLDYIPTVHEGAAARALENKGGIDERCEHNREVKAVNAEIKELKEELKQEEQKQKTLRDRTKQWKEKLKNFFRSKRLQRKQLAEQEELKKQQEYEQEKEQFWKQQQIKRDIKNAKAGLHLQELADSEEPLVRQEVAKKAGELKKEDILNKLINDSDNTVREIVENEFEKIEEEKQTAMEETMRELVNTLLQDLESVIPADTMENLKKIQQGELTIEEVEELEDKKRITEQYLEQQEEDIKQPIESQSADEQIQSTEPTEPAEPIVEPQSQQPISAPSAPPREETPVQKPVQFAQNRKIDRLPTAEELAMGALFEEKVVETDEPAEPAQEQPKKIDFSKAKERMKDAQRMTDEKNRQLNNNDYYQPRRRR